MNAPVNFAPMMADVANRLLGEPTQSKAGELRWGNKGSLSIDLAKGAWFDHEADNGGGVLDLVRRERGCDKGGALDWLKGEGLLRDDNSAAPIFYDYRDESGAVRYRVERRGKSFLQHGLDGRNGFKCGKGCMDGVTRLPYRLPELLASIGPVFVTEGEKDADRLASLGLVATCNSGGAGKFGADLAPYFDGRRVVILQDNDLAGREHAQDVRRKLGKVADCAILALPDLPPKGDVSDWLNAGGTVAELLALGEAALDAPAHDPDTGEILDDEAPQDDADPVDLWGAFDPPDMPQGLLPPVLEAWALANGENMGCDPAGLAVAALVTCAAAIPDAIKLKVKQNSDNWDESARIWAALIGNPSTKKSPILSAATWPLCRLDVEKMRAWQQRVRAWEALPADEKKANPRPPQERLRIEDATVEAAQQVLEGSPWGVMLLQDELSGLFGAMDKYSGGKGAQADRAFWLRSFNGGEMAVNRVARGTSLIPNLSVSMLGGIQPEPLRKIAGDATDDGLLQRLFPIILRPATLGCDEAMPPVNEHYRDLIEKLHHLKPPGIGGTGKLAFSEAAQAVRRGLEARHLDLQGLETINRKLAAHIGKYDGMFARLCVVWHCVENIGRHMPSEVSEATAGRVAEFLHRFLLAHAISFYAGCLGLSDDHDRLTAIAGHILAHKLERVTNRDIARGDRTMRGLKDYEVRPLLEQLEALGWLEREEAPRPSSPPHYRVNPAVHVKFEAKGRAEALRRKEARETIAGLVRP